MNWFLWVLVGWFFLKAIAAVANVGKPRPKLNPGDAAFIVVLYALLISGVLLFGAR